MDFSRVKPSTNFEDRTAGTDWHTRLANALTAIGFPGYQRTESAWTGNGHPAPQVPFDVILHPEKYPPSALQPKEGGWGPYQTIKLPSLPTKP